MKKKQLKNRLLLNKKIISSLVSRSVSNINGGAAISNREVCSNHTDCVKSEDIACKESRDPECLPHTNHTCPTICS